MGGIVSVTLQTGETKDLHFKRLGYQTAYLRCGMYGGRRAARPTATSGMACTPVTTSSPVRPSTPPCFDVRHLLAGAADHHCEVTCDGETTYGMFESHDPLTYEMAKEGRPGYSLLA
jgi:hypothetical protein